MSVESDKLGDLIDNTWPFIISNIDISISKLNTEKTEIQSQIDAVEYAEGLLETDSISVLNGKGYYGMVIGSDFGFKNLSYFGGYNDPDTDVSPANYATADSFTVSGDQTSLFVSDADVDCDCGVDGIISRVVSSSVYSSPNTTVTLNTGTAITTNLTSVTVLYGSITRGTRVDNDSFSVEGDVTSSFTAGTIIVCVDSSDLLRTVESSTFSSPNTTVTLIQDTSAPLTTSFIGAIFPDYLYGGTGWDSDPDLIANNNAFIATYNHLYTSLGLSGTFGLYDRLDKLNTAISLQQTDKTNYQSFLTLYAPYAT